VTAIIGLAIAVGVEDRPAAAPQTGPWDANVIIVGHPGFYDGVTTVCTILFSFGGAPNFVNIISEMRDPRDYNKAMILCQSITTTAYLVIGCIVYHFCGQYVASPALSSAGTLMARVLYGIALPGLLAGCVLNCHLPAKNGKPAPYFCRLSSVC
jgi:amino acid transporter